MPPVELLFAGNHFLFSKSSTLPQLFEFFFFSFEIKSVSSEHGKAEQARNQAEHGKAAFLHLSIPMHYLMQIF